MVAFTDDHFHNLHPDQIAAVRYSAERQAVMVGELLTALDQQLRDAGCPTGSQGLPVGYLLELGALCQLRLWEDEGLTSLLPSDLPSSQQAIADILRRLTEAPQQFRDTSSCRLGHRVLQVVMEQFAWAGPNLLEADVVVGDVDEDALVESLAQLLWEHRHDDASPGQQIK